MVSVKIESKGIVVGISLTVKGLSDRPTGPNANHTPDIASNSFSHEGLRKKCHWEAGTDGHFDSTVCLAQNGSKSANPVRGQ
jgi:hypothetical protein